MQTNKGSKIDSNNQIKVMMTYLTRFVTIALIFLAAYSCTQFDVETKYCEMYETLLQKFLYINLFRNIGICISMHIL